MDDVQWAWANSIIRMMSQETLRNPSIIQHEGALHASLEQSIASSGATLVRGIVRPRPGNRDRGYIWLIDWYQSSTRLRQFEVHGADAALVPGEDAGLAPDDFFPGRYTTGPDVQFGIEQEDFFMRVELKVLSWHPHGNMWSGWANEQRGTGFLDNVRQLIEPHGNPRCDAVAFVVDEVTYRQLKGEIRPYRRRIRGGVGGAPGIMNPSVQRLFGNWEDVLAQRGRTHTHNCEGDRAGLRCITRLVRPIGLNIEGCYDYSEFVGDPDDDGFRVLGEVSNEFLVVGIIGTIE